MRSSTVVGSIGDSKSHFIHGWRMPQTAQTPPYPGSNPYTNSNGHHYNRDNHLQGLGNAFQAMGSMFKLMGELVDMTQQLHRKPMYTAF